MVNEVLNVVVGEILAGVNYSMEICLHQLCYYVNVCVACALLWLQDVGETDDIFVLEIF